MKKTVESSEGFLKLIKEWQSLEDRTISSANDLLSKTKNPMIKMIMESIKHDSEKHKVILQMITDYATKEAFSMSHEDVLPLADLLEKHIDVENQSIKLADEAHNRSRLFVTRFLISYLIADEVKHHGLLTQLNDLKRAQIATSTSSRFA
ncbi:MAG: hypothetical protein AB1638_00445 [Nitrospirota bacterium]